MSCISKEIERIKSLLKWDVDEIKINDQGFKIISEPVQREHEIHIPKEIEDSFYEVEVLHEYVHAMHHEVLPIKFSSSDFIGDIPLFCTDRVEIRDLFCCARDWFVAGHIVNACESKYLKYIQNRYDEFKDKQSEVKSETDYLILGLTSAEASKWLRLPLYNNKRSLISTLSVQNKGMSPMKSLLENLIGNTS